MCNVFSIRLATLIYFHCKCTTAGVMWSSKDVLLISIATGFIFCFATIYVQNSMTRYVNRKVQEKIVVNPFVGMGLASDTQQYQEVHPKQEINPLQNESYTQMCPPGSGKRWTPLPT